MDSQMLFSSSSSSPTLVGIALILITLVLMVLIRTWKKGEPLNLPPGPRKLPIIGNMHQLVGSLPHHKFRDMARKYGPVMHLRVGEVPTIVISSPETARQFLKVHDVSFAGRPTNLAICIITYGLSDMAFAPYGEQWRQFRKISVLELLSAKRVRSFRPIREEEAASLVRSIASVSGSVVDLSEMVLSASCSIIAKAAFGKRCKDQKAFLHALDQVVKEFGGFNIGDMFPSSKWLHVVTGTEAKLRRLHHKVDVIFESIINDHRARRLDHGLSTDDADEPTDFVDVLLGLQEQGDLGVPVTTTNIKAIIQDMFSAGSEISAIVVEWAMSLLLKNPEQMEKAQTQVRKAFDANGKTTVEEGQCLQELDYLNLVIKETLRLHPPSPLVVRESTEQCKVGDYDIPVKSKILVNVWDIGRNPKYWDDPERFDPDRFEGSQVEYEGSHMELAPFGAGKRMCPGILFGVTSVQILLASLLYHFDWRLACEELDMEEHFGLSIRRKNPLRAVPLVRRPTEVSP